MRIIFNLKYHRNVSKKIAQKIKLEELKNERESIQQQINDLTSAEGKTATHTNPEYADKELILFRLFQEILSNIIRHAQATEIVIVLNQLPNLLSLNVTDNGVGFILDEKMKDGAIANTWWDDESSNQEASVEISSIFENKVFDTPKPVKFLDKILRLATNKNAIILDSFAGSGTTAHAVLNLNKQDGGNRKFILIEMEDYAETITAERVKRVINGYADKAPTGGSFDYYSLGEPLFNEDNNLNEDVGEEKIREYVWFTETRVSYTQSETAPYLGTHNDTSYYFIYDKDGLTTLDYEALAGFIKHKAERYIVYADNCLLPEIFMREKNIEFKKIPRDITRF